MKSFIFQNSFWCFFPLIFLDDSIFRHIFKEQITDLILHNNDEYTRKTSSMIYTTNVYSHITVLFENLKHLAIVPSSVNDYPPLKFGIPPSTIYLSSTLTVLCISVYDTNDCLSLLDGRLKQLTTLIVQIYTSVWNTRLISGNMVSWWYFIVF